MHTLGDGSWVCKDDAVLVVQAAGGDVELRELKQATHAILEHVFVEKDLGVHIDSNLSFEEHIAAKIKKANQIMGLIRKSFTYLDKKSFKRLYTALVRPHLEYAQSVWSPHLKNSKIS